jgi:hypothetical protein
MRFDISMACLLSLFKKYKGFGWFPASTGARGQRRASRNHKAPVFPKARAEAAGLPPLFAESFWVSLMKAKIPTGAFPNRAATSVPLPSFQLKNKCQK